MIVRKIGILSAGKICLIICAALGLIVGFFMAMAGGLIALIPGADDAGPLSLIFGVSGIIILPLFYGALGFIVGVITAAIYNVAAGFVGGLEVEFETPPPGHGGYAAQP